MPARMTSRCRRIEQVAIIDRLLRYPRGASLHELATAIDASEKTVRRIVSFLEQRFGVHVDRLDDGTDAIWRYRNGTHRVFTDEATRRVG